MADPVPLQRALEVALWAVPAGLAAHRARGAPRGERLTWLLVTGACGVIALDKAVDLQIVVYRAGQEWVGRLAPELSSGGGAPWLRAGLLALGGALVVLVLWLLARADRARGRARTIALVGVAGVAAYVALRLVPAVGQRLTPAARWGVELVCWGLVVTGTLLDRRRADPGDGAGPGVSRRPRR